jgi:hypothetical protein
MEATPVMVDINPPDKGAVPGFRPMPALNTAHADQTVRCFSDTNRAFLLCSILLYSLHPFCCSLLSRDFIISGKSSRVAGQCFQTQFSKQDRIRRFREANCDSFFESYYLPLLPSRLISRYLCFSFLDFYWLDFI